MLDVDKLEIIYSVERDLCDRYYFCYLLISITIVFKLYNTISQK